MINAYLLLSLVFALFAGALIGAERSYHGRAAGMRTYALVCLGSTLAIIASFYTGSSGRPLAGLDIADPNFTRVIQGIVTGIGFLGAGVIVKEGLSVRGLTTAASIWVTAGIGILIGIELYAVAAVATLLTLATLSIFRQIEDRMPTQTYLHCYLRFRVEDTMDEDALRTLISNLGFQISEISYRLHGEPKLFEYRLVISSKSAEAARRLSEVLTFTKAVAEFRIAPSRD